MRLLHNAGASVPEVLDDNIDQLSNDAIPLYLVMEYFDGLTLDKYVDRDGPLTVDNSILLVLSLLKTIQCAHSEGIYHRDIKPQNIMVQESPSLRTVLLDFGLSFQLENNFDVTADSEAVGNMFMVLPEQRIAGGDRRDPRSDTTQCAGILYYCLCGKRPGGLRGPDGLPIHRSATSAIPSFDSTGKSTEYLLPILDQSFTDDIMRRFQRVEELHERLLHADAAGAVEMNSKSIKVCADEAHQRIMRADRGTQLRKFGQSASVLFNQIGSIVNKKLMTNLQEFTFDVELVNYEIMNNIQAPPDEFEEMSVDGFMIVCTHRGHKNRRAVVYRSMAKGPQIAFMREYHKSKGRREPQIVTSPWETLRWFDGDIAPDYSFLDGEVDDTLKILITDLEKDILDSL